MSRLDIVKEVIADNIELADCGLFFTRNWVGDPMMTIYFDEDEDIVVDICMVYNYFEVFGLTPDEKKELQEYYADCVDRWASVAEQTQRDGR